MDKVTLSFKVDPSMKKVLEELADQENRSLANYVITTLMKHIEDKGLSPKLKRKKK